MDLSTLVPSERIVEIVSPATKAPLGIRVTIMHIDDSRLKTLKRKLQDERQRREQRGKIISAEMQDENLSELTFATMTGWEWYNPTGVKSDKGYNADKEPKFDGKVPEFTKANVFAIFDKLPWFRDQIGEAVSETESFFQI
jgi:hypothetical protein